MAETNPSLGQKVLGRWTCDGFTLAINVFGVLAALAGGVFVSNHWSEERISALVKEVEEARRKEKEEHDQTLKAFNEAQELNLRCHQAESELALASFSLLGERNPRRAIAHTSRAMAFLDDAKRRAPSSAGSDMVVAVNAAVHRIRGLAAVASGDVALVGACGRLLRDTDRYSAAGNYFLGLEALEQLNRVNSADATEACRGYFRIAAVNQNEQGEARFFLALLELRAGRWEAAAKYSGEYLATYGSREERDRLPPSPRSYAAMADGIWLLSRYITNPSEPYQFPTTCGTDFTSLSPFELSLIDGPLSALVDKATSSEVRQSSGIRPGNPGPDEVSRYCESLIENLRNAGGTCRAAAVKGEPTPAMTEPTKSSHPDRPSTFTPQNAQELKPGRNPEQAVPQRPKTK